MPCASDNITFGLIEKAGQATYEIRYTSLLWHIGWACSWRIARGGHGRFPQGQELLQGTATKRPCLKALGLCRK